MTVSKDSHEVSRRQFLSGTGRVVCGIGLLGMGLVLYTEKAKTLPATALRPPGALPEEEFTGACIRCGLCVRECPYNTLKLSRLGQIIPTGTPYFTAREIPCEMCEDIPCVEACPTGALDPALKDIDAARMGIAVLIDHESCLNYQGLRCDVCYRVCPSIDTAITLEMQHNERSGKHALFIPTVHSESCTGCGKCEYACVLPVAAIKVLPLHLAKGSPAPHYRFGWEEKRKAGHSLTAPGEKHEYFLPDGMEYEHGGRGLINKADTPFTDDPLETLRTGEADLQQ